MPKSTQAATVWVVDDDRSVRFVLTTALRDAGYTVEGFDSAAAALSAMARQPVPDLLFTDAPTFSRDESTSIQSGPLE